MPGARNLSGASMKEIATTIPSHPNVTAVATATATSFIGPPLLLSSASTCGFRPSVSDPLFPAASAGGRLRAAPSPASAAAVSAAIMAWGRSKDLVLESLTLPPGPIHRGPCHEVGMATAFDDPAV